MFCTHCGKQIADNSLYCPFCGNSISPQTDRYSNTIGTCAETVSDKPARNKKAAIIIAGSVVLAVIAAVLIIILVQKLKVDTVNESFHNQNILHYPTGFNPVDYDSEYTFFTEQKGNRQYIMRVQNTEGSEPEPIYEQDIVTIDEDNTDNSQKSISLINNLFIWNNRIYYFCYKEVIKDDKFDSYKADLCWISKDGNQSGTVLTGSQLEEEGYKIEDYFLTFGYDHYIVLNTTSSTPPFRIDLDNGEVEDMLDVVYPDNSEENKQSMIVIGYTGSEFIYFSEDMKEIYRKSPSSKKILIYTRNDASINYACILDGYIYLLDNGSISRIRINDGTKEDIAECNGELAHFAVMDNSIYYFLDSKFYRKSLSDLNSDAVIIPSFEDDRILSISIGSGNHLWLQSYNNINNLQVVDPESNTGATIYKIYEGTTDESSSDQEESSEASQTQSKPDDNESSSAETGKNWIGVYLYDDGNEGEIFCITDADNEKISGIYVYQTEVGTYEKREFSWTLDGNDKTKATEPFQNGASNITYLLKDDRISVDYPEGWWPDRDYYFLCNIDQASQYVTNPAFFDEHSQNDDYSYSDNEDTDNEKAPFYGIWIGAFKDKTDAENFAAEAEEKGLNAGVYLTTDWDNLNSEPWYVISAGEYQTSDEAENELSDVINKGYADAYVKYTGNCNG